MRAELVSFKDVLRSVMEHNPYEGSSRDALPALPHDSERLVWRKKEISLASLPEVHPASERDVRSYAKHREKTGEEFPPIVVVKRKKQHGKKPAVFSLTIYDGEHRVAAARSVGDQKIWAFVGSTR